MQAAQLAHGSPLQGLQLQFTQYNVSSVSRSSTGRYTINFQNNMPNANYVVNFSGGNSGYPIMHLISRSVGSFEVQIGNRGSAVVDADPAMFTIYSN